MIYGDPMTLFRNHADIDFGSIPESGVKAAQQASLAKNTVQIYKVTSPFVETPCHEAEDGSAPSTVRVYPDQFDTFGFPATISPCAAVYGDRVPTQTVRFTVDTGASHTHIPASLLGGLGKPSGEAVVADGRIVKTRTAIVHMYTRGHLLTFEALAFEEGTMALLGMDLMSKFDFSDRNAATVTLKPIGLKTCKC